MTSLTVPSRLWYENTERVLSFPDAWTVENLTSPGLEKEEISPEQIRERIFNPVEGPALATLAKGKKEAVIIFDDMTRPTPVKDVILPVLDILHQAGLKREQIRFVWALGSHGAYDMINARKKLGDYVVENYAVYNHDPFQNTVRLGRTPTGVEIWINREVMSCDLKIGIGCITPHVHVGFGGGGKIILPGVAGIESINQFHNRLFHDPMRTGLGNFDQNIMRQECNAAASMAGLDFKIDCLVNRRGKITNLYAGSFQATHTLGAQEGKDHYGIVTQGNFDIAVCNSYAKANEAAIALLLSLSVLKLDGTGTAVLISDAPEGQVPHYVMRAWGSNYGGRHYTSKEKGGKSAVAFLRKLIVMAPHPDRTMLDLICHPDDAFIVKTWEEVLDILVTDYPEKARVAVIPDGTMQYVKKPGPG